MFVCRKGPIFVPFISKETLMVKHILWSLSGVMLFASCEVIDYHPYDGKLSTDERHLNEQHIAQIEADTEDKDTLRFVLFGDTQRSYDEMEAFVQHINAQRDDLDFLIHGGDYTEYGTTAEYEWTARILQELECPYVGLIGNHDVLGNGDAVFRTLFGDDNFSFVAGNVKFVCLNTNALEYDYSNPVPDFEFILDEIQKTDAERTVVVMHAPPGSDQFNNNVKVVFHEYIRKFPNLLFCLHAHNHTVQVNDLFGDGILYYGCANMGQRNYLLFTLTPNGYTYENISY